MLDFFRVKRSRLRRAVLGAALTLAVAAGVPAPAPAASSFGLNIQSLVNWDTTWGQPLDSLPWDPYLAAMARDGMDVARTDAAWSEAQPAGAGTPYDWTVSDRIAGSLARHGIRWLPVVDLTPDWAKAAPNARPGCEAIIGRYLPPRADAFGDYAAFAGALAARYGEGGSFWAAHPELPAHPIRAYEIWNEPNVDAYWNNAPDPESYRDLYDQARAAIVAADPSARVLVGGVVWGGSVDCVPGTPNGAPWLQQLASVPGWEADGVAMHPYGGSAPSVVANVRALRRGLVAAGRPDLALEQTELGWALRPTDAPPGSQAATSATWYDEPARAGNYTIITDTLRGSDCPGDDFIGYAVVERERHAVGENPFGIGVFDFIEHWMGLYGHGAAAGAAAPTATSSAYAAAIARDRAGLNAPRDLRVCGAPAGGRLLALDLALAPAPQPGCYLATVTYRGMPVGDAELTGSPTIGTLTGTPGLDPVFTGPDGTTTLCATQLGALAVTAQVGGGSFAPDLVPPVARSAPAAVAVGAVPPPPAPPAPPAPPVTAAAPPAPACILRQLSLPRQRLSTVARRGRLTTRVTLSALAPAGPCTTTLTVSIPVRVTKKVKGKKRKRRAVREALLGTATTTISATRRTTVRIRLTKAGRRRLRKERSVKATVRIGLPQALPGAQEYARTMRLRR